MKKDNSASRKRRVRSDRLIGFRIPIEDFNKLHSLLGVKKTSISTYMRNLLRDDLKGTGSCPPHEPK